MHAWQVYNMYKQIAFLPQILSAILPGPCLDRPSQTCLTDHLTRDPISAWECSMRLDIGIIYFDNIWQYYWIFGKSCHLWNFMGFHHLISHLRLVTRLSSLSSQTATLSRAFPCRTLWPSWSSTVRVRDRVSMTWSIAMSKERTQFQQNGLRKNESNVISVITQNSFKL